MRRDLAARTASLGASGKRLLLQRSARLEQLAARLGELSPLKILERGYALVLDSSGHLVKDAAQVRAGDEITARLARGALTATVKKTRA
jgi:exodeoxyribonuclease VII large subunit